MFYKNSPMSGFEPWTSGIERDQSANIAKTTAPPLEVNDNYL